eukprot:jgi/Phyca11/100835/e_gw1.5.1004.1
MGKASKPGRQKKEDAAVVVDGTSTENDAECKPAPFEKCNWAGETTLGLVRAWKKVMPGERRKDEKTSMITQKIFDEYKTAFPTSTRSKKAVEDKLQALREMYRFISDVNVNRIAGSTGKPEWFELSKNERKELRIKHVLINSFQQNTPATFELAERALYAITSVAQFLVHLCYDFVCFSLSNFKGSH